MQPYDGSNILQSLNYMQPTTRAACAPQSKGVIGSVAQIKDLAK